MFLQSLLSKITFKILFQEVSLLCTIFYSQILNVELHVTKIIQFVRRGCKSALVLPHLALQHFECAMAISNFPSTRILIPSIFKTCLQEDAAH